MARIRSDKPEAYQSETLAEVSLAAERTFKGMATIADDRGRLVDKPAVINGSLWAMRGNHTKDDLDAELAELVAVGLVCRYVGCDGKRYLHLVSWDQHQKIDRPSKSRLPRCPHHLGPENLAYCGLHEGECNPRDDSRDSREGSRDLQHTQTGQAGSGGHLASTGAEVAPTDSAPGDTGGNGSRHDQGKRKSSRESREGSMQDLGSRTVDRGSRTRKPPAPPGAGARLPDMPDDPPDTPAQRANRLARFFAELRPMSNFNAAVKIIRMAVDAGHSDDAIEAGLKKLDADNRGLTAESLRRAIEGPPKAGNSGGSTGEDRARQALDAGAQAAAIIEGMKRR